MEPLAYAGLSLLGLRQALSRIDDLERDIKELYKLDSTSFPSYILYDSGLRDPLGRAIIYAKNCRTGLIEFKGDALIVLNSVRDASPENATIMFRHGDYILSSKFTSSKKLRFIGEGSGTRLLPSGSFDSIDPTNLSLMNIVWRDGNGIDHDMSFDPREVLKEFDIYLYEVAPSTYLATPVLTSDGVQDTDEKQTGAADTWITVFEATIDIGARRKLKGLYFNLEALFRATTTTADVSWVWQARNKDGTYIDLHPAVTNADIGTSYVSKVMKGHFRPTTNLDETPLDIRLLLKCNETNAGLGKVRNTSFVTVKVWI
jgi:hypothetical protein